MPGYKGYGFSGELTFIAACGIRPRLDIFNVIPLGFWGIFQKMSEGGLKDEDLGVLVKSTPNMMYRSLAEIKHFPKNAISEDGVHKTCSKTLSSFSIVLCPCCRCHTGRDVGDGRLVGR